MRIVNLTQHPATSEQKAAGVFDLGGEWYAILKRALDFCSVPDEAFISIRALAIATIAANCRPRPDAAMIGGAPWLMAPLARELREHGIQPLFAFSVREAEEQVQPDGSVRKVTIFRHKGFVPAVE